MTDDARAVPDLPNRAAPESGGEELVPGWLNRLAAISWRVLVTVALVVVAGLAIVQLSIVTGSILVGLIVTAVVYPLVERLRARGWPRARAAGAVSVLALLVVVVTLVLMGLALLPYAAEIVRQIGDGLVVLSNELERARLPAPVVLAVNQAAEATRDQLVAAVQALVTPIANFVTILIIGGFLTFYLLEDGDRAWTSATSNLADWRAAELTGRGAIAFEQIGGYLRGTAVLAVIDAITVWLFLILLGVPLAGPLAVIVFVGGFIPYLGGILTAAAVALVTLATQGPLPTLVILGLIALTKALENRFVAPIAYGPNTRPPVALAVIALLAGGVLFGAVGLFAAVPIVAAVLAIAPAIVQSLGTMKDSIDTMQQPSPEENLVPLWLDRLGQWSWRALVVLGLAWLVFQVVVVPFFSGPVVLAILVGPALAPLAAELRRRGFSPSVAVLSVLVATIAVIAVVLYLTIASLADSMSEIVGQAATGAGKLGLGSAPEELVDSLGSGIASNVASVVTGLVQTTLVIGVAVLLMFFLLRDGAGWWAQILARLPANRRERVDQVGVAAVDIMRGTMTGTAIASFAGAVLQWLTMVVLGLPLAFPIGVLMFFAGFVPYIGSLIVTTLGFLVAVAVGDQSDVILMAIFTIVFNLVQGNIVAPLVFGKTVSVHPAVVLLAAPAGAAVGGIIGMVLMVPILAIIKRTWRIVIHLFDPESDQPPMAPAPVPRASAEPPVVARESPAVEGAGP
jgi:predicted PurR-regulated permease PerM